MLGKILITALACIVWTVPRSVQAMADDISVEASVSANRISLKDAAQLTLTIHGAKVDNGPVELPKIDGIDSNYVGPSTRISIVNGQYSSARSFIYNLFPTKTGHIQIPALTVTVSGKDYTTSPIDLDVEAAPANNAAAGPSKDAPLTEENLKDRLFIQVSVPKDHAYLGERVPLHIKLLVNGLPIRNIQYPQLEKNGFTLEDFPQPRQYAQAVNGVKYDVVEFETSFYPTRAGDLTIGPVQIQGSLLYKTQQPDNGFLNDSFFNNFFDNFQQRPLAINAQALNFHVLPVPEEGKPAVFSGGVGQLEFNASVSPDKVKAGDPLTLRMKISGQGNFKSIQMPVFEDSRFKVYEAKIKDEGSTKTLEQVIIPASPDIKEVPAITFSYFDAEANQYKTLTQGPFALTVTALAPGQEFKAVGFTDLSTAARVEQVDYVQKYIKQPLQKMAGLVKTVQFWLVIIGLGTVWALWLFWRGFQERLNTDRAFHRRLNALKNARQGIKQAQAGLQGGKAGEFYNALVKTLNNYLADKLDQPAGGLTWETVSPLLRQRNVPPQDLDAIQNIFRSGDLVRFAGGQSDPSRMTEHLAQVQSLLTSLEKYLK